MQFSIILEESYYSGEDTLEVFLALPTRLQKCVAEAITEGRNAKDTTKNGWVVRFYGISTFVVYLTPNPFLYK